MARHSALLLLALVVVACASARQLRAASDREELAEALREAKEEARMEALEREEVCGGRC